MNFDILASREYVTVPKGYAAEMRAYDTRVGEFRAHYAGFFDPGFGMPELNAARTRAVLEVRSHDVPFLIEQGQTVCRLVYEPMSAVPDSLYGDVGSTSNYQSQGLVARQAFHSGLGTGGSPVPVPVESRIILDIFGQKDQALRHSRLMCKSHWRRHTTGWWFGFWPI